MLRPETLIGRDAERDELRSLWDDVKTGRGRFTVVSGEAGMGKTHLVEDLCAHVATSDSTVVAWGPCSGSEAPALWPWRAILRTVGVALPTGGATRSWTDPQASAARAHEAIVDALRTAFTAPGVVVIDDAHWADRDSLSALRLCIGELRDLPVLLVITMRPDEPTPTASAIRELLADVAGSSHRVHLGGLRPGAIKEMIDTQVGHPVAAATAETVWERTGGNPLFVRELVRLMGAEGTLAADGASRGPLPPLMRDILLRRVSRLSEPTKQVLDVAAVAGRRVALETLVAAMEQTTERIARCADEAVAEELVTLEGGSLQFAHDLIREALVDELTPDDRRTIHARLADALLATGGPGSALSEIAGHLAAAVPVVSRSRVAEMSLRAGRDAMERHAPGVAVAQLRRGVEAVGRDDPLATELNLCLGMALATAGDGKASWEAFDAAADSARAQGDADSLARAAVGQAGMNARPRTDTELVDLLEEALAARDGRRDALTAEVMCGLSHSLLFSNQLDRRQRLADDAVAMAREIGDDDARSHALYVWLLVHESATNFDRRLERAEELLDVARASGSPELEASALHHHARQMAEKGDYVTYDADVAACATIADQAASVPWQWTALLNRTMRLVMTGDFVEGERLGDEAFAIGAASQNEAAGATYGAHLMALRTWQGRLDEMLPLAIASAGQYRELPAVWASVPYIRAETGDLEQAAVELADLVDDDRMRALPGSQSWTVAVAMLARAAHLTDDADSARRVRSLLDPLEDRHIVGPYADCYFGPAALYRGLCAVATGDLDTAVSDLRRAVTASTNAGAIPVAAWSAAELFVARSRRGDSGLEAQLATARSSLARLGMVRHLERLRNRTAAGSASGRTAESPEIEAYENAFVRVGAEWSITFGGRTTVLEHTKGFQDLHRLVTNPDVELHVLELMADGGDVLAGVGTQPVLDEQAKQTYRRRLEELDEEIEDADRCADPVRSERAQVERDALIGQLRSAVGLGGRDRAIPAEPERARQAVRARIRYALDKVGDRDPDLHRHLRNAVSTGMYCSYRPETPTRWRT